LRRYPDIHGCRVMDDVVEEKQTRGAWVGVVLESVFVIRPG
jgi:hypothetical protein